MKDGILIRLDGTDMRLCYTLNAMCDTEARTGIPFDELLRFSNVFRDLRALLWCGLEENYPSLTLKQAGSLIEAELERGRPVDDIAKVCLQALSEQSFFRAVPEGGQKNEYSHGNGLSA